MTCGFLYLLLSTISWLIVLTICSVIALALSQNYRRKSASNEARFWASYIIVLLIALVLSIGQYWIPDDYYANLVTELIGIAITILVIAGITAYLNGKEHTRYREIVVRTCRHSLFKYCLIWINIYQPDRNFRKNEMDDFETLEDFFLSGKFYQKVISFDFDRQYSDDKNWVTYTSERMKEFQEFFQSMLMKYSHKLSADDISKFEYFGGSAAVFRAFDLMELFNTIPTKGEVQSVSTFTRKPGMDYVFKKISQDTFQKHFKKLVDLIDEHNGLADSSEEITLDSILNPKISVFEDRKVFE